MIYGYWCKFGYWSLISASAPLNDSWDSDNESPRDILPLTSDLHEGFSSRPERDYLMDKAEDFLLADDPAIFSDEFSGGEEWFKDTYWLPDWTIIIIIHQSISNILWSIQFKFTHNYDVIKIILLHGPVALTYKGNYIRGWKH